VLSSSPISGAPSCGCGGLEKAQYFRELDMIDIEEAARLLLLNRLRKTLKMQKRRSEKSERVEKAKETFMFDDCVQCRGNRKI
jgi:hypothetical protein